ncbi:RNA polymerase sigma factor SigZ [Rubripirellula tenax]|uniref:RNA polymerase sigma factor SigZ n=1 Tax=Rubripirellula tenax TaxID=2528015 RepID=A0A5C6F5K5_9BACT|nr:sigma-70 family RNA polymerase sigma factor [Rubripirellula tenax]TWU54751.1 RNA polymerase sigma factor SigZ [Rubripirellula tenax]
MCNAEIVRYFALSQPKLRAFIRSMVFNPSDVDDILQEVAVIAIENSHRFDASRSIDAWVFGITRNRILKHFESHKRQNLCFSTELVDALTQAAEVDTDSHDSLEALHGCLEKIEQPHRDLLIKRHEPGVTARQLAREIGYTDTRMSRLLQTLYARLMNCVQNEISGVA